MNVIGDELGTDICVVKSFFIVVVVILVVAVVVQVVVVVHVCIAVVVSCYILYSSPVHTIKT